MNALTRYKMQAKQEVHMFTERKHLRLYKETRILIQRNHALTQRNACAYNKIFLHLNPIVNRLAQRNACTCTKKNTPLYKEVPCTYTKKYHALIQRSTMHLYKEVHAQMPRVGMFTSGNTRTRQPLTAVARLSIILGCFHRFPSIFRLLVGILPTLFS